MHEKVDAAAVDKNHCCGATHRSFFEDIIEIKQQLSKCFSALDEEQNKNIAITTLKFKIKDLHHLCCKANQRISEDSRKIDKLRADNFQKESSLQECDSFVTRFRKRESELWQLVETLEQHIISTSTIQREIQQPPLFGCFGSKNSKSKSVVVNQAAFCEIVKNLKTLLVDPAEEIILDTRR